MSLLCARPQRPDEWKADAFEQPCFRIHILLNPSVTLSLLRPSVCTTQPTFAWDLPPLSVSSEGRGWISSLSTSEWSELGGFPQLFKRRFGTTTTKNPIGLSCTAVLAKAGSIPRALQSTLPPDSGYDVATSISMQPLPLVPSPPGLPSASAAL